MPTTANRLPAICLLRVLPSLPTPRFQTVHESAHFWNIVASPRPTGPPLDQSPTLKSVGRPPEKPSVTRDTPFCLAFASLPPRFCTRKARRKRGETVYPLKTLEFSMDTGFCKASAMLLQCCKNLRKPCKNLYPAARLDSLFRHVAEIPLAPPRRPRGRGPRIGPGRLVFRNATKQPEQSPTALVGYPSTRRRGGADGEEGRVAPLAKPMGRPLRGLRGRGAWYPSRQPPAAGVRCRSGHRVQTGRRPLPAPRLLVEGERESLVVVTHFLHLAQKLQYSEEETCSHTA